jgi:5-methylcytosine-specific restriction endonuclease McrA
MQVVCKHCKKQFSARRYSVRPDPKFCSRECWRLSLIKDPGNRIGTCEICGKQFYNKHFYKPNRFCSRSCTDEYYRKYPRSGRNCPAYIDGRTKEDRLQRCRFKRDIQKLVFERDNYSCQICGQHNGCLQVDHIQPWSEYVEGRFDINNCRTLCQECHYKITYGRPMPKNIKAWGHNLHKNERIL